MLTKNIFNASSENVITLSEAFQNLWSINIFPKILHFRANKLFVKFCDKCCEIRYITLLNKNFIRFFHFRNRTSRKNVLGKMGKKLVLSIINSLSRNNTLLNTFQNQDPN